MNLSVLPQWPCTHCTRQNKRSMVELCVIVFRIDEIDFHFVSPASILYISILYRTNFIKCIYMWVFIALPLTGRKVYTVYIHVLFRVVQEYLLYCVYTVYIHCSVLYRNIYFTVCTPYIYTYCSVLYRNIYFTVCTLYIHCSVLYRNIYFAVCTCLSYRTLCNK